MRNHLTTQLVIAGTFALVACTDGAGPRGAGPFRLAMSTRQAPAAPVPPAGQAVSASLQAAGAETFTNGTNTLVITSVELVLREVELKRVEEDNCEAESGGAEGASESDAHGCEELEAGPILVDLPLGSTERVFTADIPAGTYDRLEFQIHKPESDGDEPDHGFLMAHPDFAGISVRAKGTFNGADFTYTSDLNVEQELALDPPLVVSPGTPATLTVRLDLGGWFRDGSTLVDPQTAAKGGENEKLVRDNVIGSFRSFRDNDEDGLDDDHEDSDGGH